MSTTTSTNWSGYAVETNLASPQKYAFTDVTGSWIVPSVSSTGYSATWIGLDGDSSKTVEQIGTEQDYINGKAVYYAWYEMYPKLPVKLDLVVQPGDTITADVHFTGPDIYTFTIEDFTNGQLTGEDTISVQSSKPIRSSAEWIEEGTGTLADFHTVTFTNALATANGHTGPISDPAWQTDQITMVSKSGGATPSGLLQNSPPPDGSSFSITYGNQVATLTKNDGAHAANMALLGDAGQHYSQLVGVADVHHDGHLV
jgi:hypothetical protein